MTWGRLVFISFCVWVWDRKCLSPLLSPSSSSRETSRADTGDSRPQPGTETLTLSGPLSTQQFPQSLSVHIQTAMLLSWGAWDRSGLGSYGASWQAVMANTHIPRDNTISIWWYVRKTVSLLLSLPCLSSLTTKPINLQRPAISSSITPAGELSSVWHTCTPAHTPRYSNTERCLQAWGLLRREVNTHM